MKRTMTGDAPRGRSSSARMLAALDLFSIEEPILSAAAISEQLGLPRATAYRYLKTLCEAGLLLRLGNSDFCLGPRIVQLDRQIQLSDPLIAAGRAAMQACLTTFPWDALLLCSMARDLVLCVHQEVRPNSEVRLRRARGMPFPLFRGPASLVILAQLPVSRMRELYIHAIEEHDVSASDLGADWDQVRRRLRDIKKRGYAISRNEFQTGLLGISAPIMENANRVIGSVSAVSPQDSAETFSEDEMVRSIKACALDIETRISRAPAMAHLVEEAPAPINGDTRSAAS